MRHSSVRSRSPHKGFHPSDIAAIRNGYWWTASGTTGFGTTGFRVIEQNGHSSFDLVQATVASQPTAIAENGGVQFRLRKSGDANPTVLSTSGDVAAGWTGSTYIAGWYRLPDASGAISNTGSLFAHRKSGVARINLSLVTTGGGRQNGQVSTDGTTVVTHGWANVLAGAAWHWLELIFDTSQASPDRLAMYADSVVQTRALAGTIPATIADVSAPITLGYSAITSLANADNTDWCSLYYGNGIPTSAERALLARHAAPIAVSF